MRLGKVFLTVLTFKMFIFIIINAVVHGSKIKSMFSHLKHLMGSGTKLFHKHETTFLTFLFFVCHLFKDMYKS